MKTVKAAQTKSISAKELFSMTYGTYEMYKQERISVMKQKVKERMEDAEFYENDGVIFYTATIKGEEKKDNTLTIIDIIKDFTYTMKAKKELWKFGFVNKKTGEITLLFDGEGVATCQNEAFKFYEIAKVVTNVKFQNKSDLITFAHKD